MNCKVCDSKIYECPRCTCSPSGNFSVCSFCWENKGLDKLCKEYDVQLSKLTYKKNQAILDEIIRLRTKEASGDLS